MQNGRDAKKLRELYPTFRTLAVHSRFAPQPEAPVDLSFSRFEADVTVTALPPDLAVLMVGVAARQAASPTAMMQAALVTSDARTDRFAPEHGAFNVAVARLLAPEATDARDP